MNFFFKLKMLLLSEIFFDSLKRNLIIAGSVLNMQMHSINLSSSFAFPFPVQIYLDIFVTQFIFLMLISHLVICNFFNFDFFKKINNFEVRLRELKKIVVVSS